MPYFKIRTPAAHGDANKANYDEEYMSLMAELGEAPPPQARHQSGGYSGRQSHSHYQPSTQTHQPLAISNEPSRDRSPPARERSPPASGDSAGADGANGGQSNKSVTWIQKQGRS